MEGDYPWYRLVTGDEIAQGDIIEQCPVFLPPADLDFDATAPAVLPWAVKPLIVLTQTCDLVTGREKVSEVLLCPLWRPSEFTTGHLSTAKGLEDVRRGYLPGLHMLAPCDLAGFPAEIRIVDFRRVHTLPLGLFRRVAREAGERLRLMPPYREHLSPAFARYFMRVGLPVDVPAFR